MSRPKHPMAPANNKRLYGELAQRIVNIADEAGVPIYRDDSVAALLVMLNAGETIPKELYQIVAAIYADVVYTADKMRKK